MQIAIDKILEQIEIPTTFSRLRDWRVVGSVVKNAVLFEIDSETTQAEDLKQLDSQLRKIGFELEHAERGDWYYFRSDAKLSFSYSRCNIESITAKETRTANTILMWIV